MDHDGNKREVSDAEEKGKKDQGQDPADVTAEYGQEVFKEMQATTLADTVLRHALKSMSTLTINIKLPSPWLTVREAEDYARVPHGVISKAVKDGELPAYQRREGTTTVIAVTDIDDWIRNLWISSTGTRGTGGNDGGLR